MLPIVIAENRIIDTDVKFKFDKNTQNLTVTVEADSGTEDFIYNLNDTNVDVSINAQFIRDLNETGTCELFKAVSNFTATCSEKVEAYDRIIGQKQLSSEINDLQIDLLNYSNLATNHLNTCEQGKKSCETSKNLLFTKDDLDKASEGKIGYFWAAAGILLVIAYYNWDKIRGSNRPRVAQNNPELNQKPRRFS